MADAIKGALSFAASNLTKPVRGHTDRASVSVYNNGAGSMLLPGVSQADDPLAWGVCGVGGGGGGGRRLGRGWWGMGRGPCGFGRVYVCCVLCVGSLPIHGARSTPPWLLGV